MAEASAAAMSSSRSLASYNEPVHSKAFAQEWIDKTSETAEVGEATSLESQCEQGIATRLYLACLNVFRALCHGNSKTHINDNLQSASSSSMRSSWSLGRTSESRDYTCHYCSESFSRHHNLKSHLLTHGMDNPYRCASCSGRFLREHDLHQHSCPHTPENKPTMRLPEGSNPQVGQGISLDEQSVLREQLGKFYLWGEGFRGGSLDKAVDQSDDLRNTVLELICDIGMVLLCSKCSSLLFSSLHHVRSKIEYRSLRTPVLSRSS